jgi:hypothetical protein
VDKTWPGYDQINQPNHQRSSNALHHLINRIWNEEQIPDDWRKGLLSPRKAVKERRPISLQLLKSKVQLKRLVDKTWPGYDQINQPNHQRTAWSNHTQDSSGQKDQVQKTKNRATSSTELPYAFKRFISWSNYKHIIH